ncbi:MAG: UDP-N-acetylglucosamine 2-epimerase [Sulfurimonas sp. RIFOXYD2_FULL_37_8]|nr:MAG: UDP-N-acetylglucosamine 2-epimerase [Sulfurimonas sp. RIFOXYD2_FULL_37_8]
MCVVGTRPEIIKLSRIIHELKKYFNLVLVHTGQNYDYELNQVFFDDLGVPKPDHFLNSAGDTAAQTIANVISGVDKLIDQVKPGAFLIYGDTNSCLCVISAKRKQIPIFHMEAGNRCFDQRVPEEINRKIVDHLSDINMVHSEHARRYLLSEGLRPEMVIKTGSPMGEVLEFYKKQIHESEVLNNLGLQEKEYFIVSVHREENVDYPKNFTDLLDSLEAIAKKYNKRVIVSTHPRTRKKLEALNKSFDQRVEFMKPLGFFDYNKLQLSAYCVISDSGTITEESNFLGFPGIMIRQAHERPEGMDVGKVIMSGLEATRVIESIEMITREHDENKHLQKIEDYQSLLVSTQVVNIIQSYIDYINRTIWHKVN